MKNKIHYTTPVATRLSTKQPPKSWLNALNHGLEPLSGSSGCPDDGVDTDYSLMGSGGVGAVPRQPWM